MAVKNMQTVATKCAKTNGVIVAGTDCAGSMRIDGRQAAPILSLFSLSQPGPYPMSAATDADLPAEAALRIGRSGSEAGANPSATLARSASGTVLSTRSASLTNRHRERKPMPQGWSKTNARG